MHQKNQTIVLFAGGAILLIAAIFFLRPDGSAPTVLEGDRTPVVSGGLVVENPFLNLGTLSMSAGSVITRFTLTNNGSDPVSLNSIYTSCMCTEAFIERDGDLQGPFGMPGHGFMPRLGDIVDPGASFILRVVFDPAAHGPTGVGQVEREVYIESDAGLTKVGFSAVVTP